MGLKEVTIGATNTKTTGFHTEKAYVVCQYRMPHDSIMRIQVAGPGVGTQERDVKIADKKVAAWLKTVPCNRPSLAGSSSQYAPLLARPESEGMVRLQVPHPELKTLNRDYGACLLIQSRPLKLTLCAILK